MRVWSKRWQRSAPGFRPCHTSRRMNVCKVTILCGPVYINSPVRAGLQRRGRLICCPGESGHLFTTSKQTWLTRSRRFTASQPVHLFELPLTRRSLFHLSIAAGSTSTHQDCTCLHERIIEYEQVTAWEARFSSNSLEENCHVLSSVVGIGRLNGHAHKSPPLQFG